MTEADDDIDIDDWMAMTDAERDQEWERTLNEYNEWWASLTLADQFRHRRRTGLKSCATVRRLSKRLAAYGVDPEEVGYGRAGLKKRQRRLAELRIERAGGLVGHA